jgi:hypothetical protein
LGQLKTGLLHELVELLSLDCKAPSKGAVVQTE